MMRLVFAASLAFVLVVAPDVLASGQSQDVDLRSIELVIPGAEEGATTAGGGEQLAPSWRDRLAPAAKLGLTAIAIGVPLVVIVAGRLWHRLPAEDRALIVLSMTLGRGRTFRDRVRSLAEHSRGVTPLSMLVAPKAFDAALASANHAERAFGQPLRHAVHGFRKG
ncbi:MAG: hypothetical protein AAFX79_11260 [Planctomycetota bacterium]